MDGFEIEKKLAENYTGFWDWTSLGAIGYLEENNWKIDDFASGIRVNLKNIIIARRECKESNYYSLTNNNSRIIKKIAEIYVSAFIAITSAVNKQLGHTKIITFST